MISILLILMTTWMSSAFFMGNQCGYPQTSFPIQQQDYQHSQQVQIRNLEASRSQLEQRMAQLNRELQNARNGLYYYFDSQWANAMVNHMDNGFDCCAPGTTAASRAVSAQRLPAGTDSIDSVPVYEVPQETVQSVDTTPYLDEPAQQPTSSCYGYSQNYCQGYWGQNDSPGHGGFCLQTGFAATSAWYGRACRGGGRIDPGVCQTVSRYPNDYQQCVRVIDYYYQMSYEKRRIAGQIQAYNNEINGYRRNNGSSFGNFLGQFIGTVGPFLLGQYLNYQIQRNVRHQYQAYPHQPYPSQPSYGSLGTPNSLSYRSTAIQVPYHSRGYEPAPSFHGPQYGYPYQYAGNYGGVTPGLLQGAFGCSQGIGGGGGNILGLLFGGANLTANLGLTPPYTMPYQYGGIYNQPPGYSTPFSPVFSSYPPTSFGAQGGIYQNGSDAFFYSRLGEARQRIWANQVGTINQQYAYPGYGLGQNPYQFPQFSLPQTQYQYQTSVPYGAQWGVQTPGFYPSMGFDWGSMMQSLFGGGASATLQLQGYSGY